MDTYQASRSPTAGVRLDPVSFPRVIYDRNNVSLVNMSESGPEYITGVLHYLACFQQLPSEFRRVHGLRSGLRISLGLLFSVGPANY